MMQPELLLVKLVNPQRVAGCYAASFEEIQADFVSANTLSKPLILLNKINGSAGGPPF